MSTQDKLSKALQKFDADFLKELAYLSSIPEDDRGRINRILVMECVVRLRHYWDTLSTERSKAHFTGATQTANAYSR